ncbi:uncharacterized protein LOC122815868 [Protopterus annectens]|uniref:uncharacterized protein LOC122815868 n=1 Tax=Protopterus annectens TaxID=7888 RepID=UPI001CFB866E|nr:uncharacterized protein LOC122815868 [Protopterus annectens]
MEEGSNHIFKFRVLAAVNISIRKGDINNLLELKELEWIIRLQADMSPEQVEAPDIHIEEKGNKISCTRKNSNYKYRLCILYQNDHQVQDTGLQYNTTPTEEVSFTVPDLPDEALFKCLCYTTGERWTRNSSAITKAGKLIPEPTTSAKTRKKTNMTRVTATSKTDTNCDYTNTNTVKLCYCLILFFMMVIFTLMSMHMERTQNH